ncbi:MAG: alanine--tRNA ligase [Candidatus Omnitrophica bacterium]|nr:alanine--tRNA ligase [Candidatus Omnitrophota bacterium]
MTGNEVRKKFLDFFASKKHTIVASDSLVPKNDPTVLFTTAGMQQFKRQFLGNIDEYTRAVSSQKCLRTDDLDEVGKTDFHHTFFEMLGNFSFGDYFKKDAIAWAWEFLTQELNIPKEKLWVSIYKDDAEAESIWLEDIGIDAKKFVKLGDKSNFWPANAKEKGPNGPCGPCSEIFYDYGVNKNCKSKKCNPDCDCGRFSEIWNLVFTQFDRKEGGSLEPLPNKNIDTGMGLERLVAVIQGKKNNYETDLFQPILDAIDRETNAHNDKYSLDFVDKCIVADHIRAIVFGINDGVTPSNSGRGYVIKKLIIDATDKMIPLEKTGVRLWKLVSVICNIMWNHYPELKSQQKQGHISAVIRQIQESYLETRKERMPQLIQEINQIIYELDNDEEIIDRLGRLIFKYRDTFGLTESALEKALDQSGIPKNEYIKGANEVFNDLMKNQQAKSRASSKMTGDVFTGTDLELNVPKTEFLGHERIRSTSTILQLFIDNEKVNTISSGDHVKVILDRTPFYAEAGGQIGDTGYITTGKGRIRVCDTQGIDDIFIHSGTVEEGSLRMNDQVSAEIDLERRLSIMRHHTATHLLQAALRSVLGSHVQQQGSYVSEDRLRFDFTHHKAITTEEIERIEQYVNEHILNCDTVTKDLLPIEQAQKSGALAFFAEKYGKVVRVVTINDYSKEFCGGTHLDSTGQIGLFKITTESAIAQGIRRLEAKTGIAALQYITDEEHQLAKMSQILKAPTAKIVDRLNAQTKRLKSLEKEIEQFRFEAIKGSVDTIIAKAEQLNGIKIISHVFKNVNIELLRRVSDLLKQKSKSSIILLGARTQENASILLAVTDDLIKKGIKANELIKEIAPLINGSGGGRPQLAQAGSKEIKKVDHAIKQANKLIKDKVKK